MKYLIILTFGIVGYVVWRLLPPRDPIGSIVPGFNKSYRRMMMLRAEAEQDFKLFH